MATYRVVLRVEVDDAAIARARDAEALEDLKGDYDYLARYVEEELHWAAKSFSDLEIQHVKKVAE